MQSDRPAFGDFESSFRWALPEAGNIATAVITRHARMTPDRPALVVDTGQRDRQIITFRQVEALSNRLANWLCGQGLQRGDRLALLMPQSVDTLVAHIAAFKAGLITVPVSVLFGPEALLHRLGDSGARAAIATPDMAEKIAAIKPDLPDLQTILAVDGSATGSLQVHPGIRQASDDYEPQSGSIHDPALMIYTSGTTGLSKGALHGHRVLWGHLPGISLSQNLGLQGKADELLWTPADWAWAGGLLNALLPALYYGVPVLIAPMPRFDAAHAIGIMRRNNVTRAFLPPTALRMMRAADVKPDGLGLRSIGSAGEALGTEAHEWVREAFGLPANEFYGQTECNAVIGSCQSLKVWKAGTMGKPVPGHRIALIDERGEPVPVGTPGQIAIARPDPVMFLGYWNQPEATDARFIGDWMATGDQAFCDGEGYLHFLGRSDDIINSSGYRIGPAEIEDCLAGHPAVKAAAVVGKPDALRTEIIKAYVVVKDGVGTLPDQTQDLVDSIQAYVRTRLSAYEYPREIAFVAEIPLTTSGKVIRRHFREIARAE